MKIDFIPLDGGVFRMGSDEADIERYQRMFPYAGTEFSNATVKSWFMKQVPAHMVELASFEMAATLITRAQFGQFEQAVLGSPSALSRGDPDLPVEAVSYFQARQFCAWLSALHGDDITLPTEAEWEFAASSRGTTIFPWGDEWDSTKANTAEFGLGRVSHAEEFAAGASAQGIFDLAGNLEEWTDSFYLPYPGGSFIADDISAEQGPSYPVLRGGSYSLHGDLCLAMRRHGYRADYALTGFRVVRRTPHLARAISAAPSF